MKKIMQFRYYGDGNDNNYPEGLTAAQLAPTQNKSSILQSYGSITQLGIQGKPNIKFYLNNTLFPISLGDMGVYEIDLQNRGTINSLKFDLIDLQNNYPDNTTNMAGLLIDIIYEG